MVDWFVAWLFDVDGGDFSDDDDVMVSLIFKCIRLERLSLIVMPFIGCVEGLGCRGGNYQVDMFRDGWLIL